MTESRFAFGRNWQKFSKVLDEARIAEAVRSLKNLLQEESLTGRRFLDVGSGSGLSSVAAARLGASVHAFDYDLDSVRASEDNLQRFVSGSTWRVERGSALDKVYIDTLGSYDIVYSWGVLHHTGDMWRALDLVMGVVVPGGKLALAIYNDQGGASRRWLAVKRLYVKAPRWIRLLMVGFFAIYFEGRQAAARALRLKNPIRLPNWRRRENNRGMSVWHDLVDWVGGYPFEVATPEAIFAFAHKRGFRLEGLKTVGGGHGCNEFLFVKAG